MFKSLRASLMALWPRMSSREVGSSINHGLNGARCFIYSIASGINHILI